MASNAYNLEPSMTLEKFMANFESLGDWEERYGYLIDLGKKLKSEWNRSYSGRPKVRINTVGFFYESPDVGAFLWALARENDGSFVGMSKP